MNFSKYSPKWIDWSAWNREVEAGKYVDADLYSVLKLNPSIEGVTLRLCDNFGHKDIRFDNYYDMAKRAGVFVDAYAWPNATEWSAREAVEAWMDMLGDRKVKFMWCDHELDYGLDPMAYARMAAACFEVGRELMGVPQGVYTALWFWGNKVNHNEFLRWLSGKQQVYYWMAEYPWPKESYVEAKDWDEITKTHFKYRPSTLSGGETVRWQISSQIGLDGYTYESDGSFQKGWFSGEIYRVSWIQKKIHRLKKLLG